MSNVCHTDEQCVEMYQRIPADKKAPVLEFLRKELEPDREDILAKVKEDPEGWFGPYHFNWGMGIRNLLRTNGYGEEYFNWHNSDDYYVYLVEEALGVGKTWKQAR